MTRHDWIAVLDFGSQYTQLIARRIREQHVYCEILRHDTTAEEIAKRSPHGLVLSGGPASVTKAGSPRVDPAIFELGVPVLGICYGMQLMAQMLGGEVQPGNQREFGGARISVKESSGLFHGIEGDLEVWMSHGDQVSHMPGGFKANAKTSSCPVAAMSDTSRRFHGLQFHPEVVHTPRGIDILCAFLFQVCGCGADWTMEHFITEQISSIQSRVGDGHVVCGPPIPSAGGRVPLRQSAYRAAHSWCGQSLPPRPGHLGRHVKWSPDTFDLADLAPPDRCPASARHRT